MRGDAYRRRYSVPGGLGAFIVPGAHNEAIHGLAARARGGSRLDPKLRGESDITDATPADAGLEHPVRGSAEGARSRPPRPSAMAPMGTMRLANPQLRVGFIADPSIVRLA